MQKVMWSISKEENDKIQDIFEKKSAIENLFKIIDKDHMLYNSLLEDEKNITLEFKNWWAEQLEKHPDVKYESLWVNFVDSCIIGEC